MRKNYRAFAQVAAKPGVSLLLLVKESVVDVRPEFLEDKCHTIQSHVCEPTLTYLRPCLISAWIVRARNACGCTCAYDLRRVECLISRVRARNQYARECVAGPLDHAAAAQRVIAGIMPQRRWQNGLDHVILDSLICESMPVVAAIPCSPLAEFRIRILCLADARQNAHKNEC